SYVIINPSCDLKIKCNDIVYLIRPSPFSAQKTFERHNSRRKSTLNPIVNSGGGSNQEEMQKAAFSLFSEQRERGAGTRRRSSAGSVGQRSNSLRVSQHDDILLRRSNSLRQGLGMGLTGRRYCDEIGLPTVSRTVPPTPSSRHTRMNLNGCINFEVTPPDDTGNNQNNNNGIGGTPSCAKPPPLQGTIV
ncbi:unnamed protein product, partial [Allacma fusca]